MILQYFQALTFDVLLSTALFILILLLNIKKYFGINFIMAQYLGLDKIGRLFNIVKQNGGIIGSIRKLYRTDELKAGTLVGIDKFGNKYYENKMYFYGRTRWVDYTEAVNLDYDGSQVPPEWHRWLHYITDEPPTVKKPVDYKWLMDYTPNMSGTDKAYTPYSTTKPKIQAWVPPK